MFGGLGYLNKLGASGGLVFSPGQLFSGGEQGAWYDPSDNTTMFQDAAGTTPVTAVEQAVGLILDKSKGLVLGPELVTNGNFSNGTTGWTITGAWAESGGQFVKTGGSTATASQAILTIGKTYRITVDVVAVSTNVLIYAGSGNAQTVTTPGTKTFTVVCLGDTSLYVQCLTTATATIDNISVRELAGNHAFQSTSASRPTLRARYNLLTYSEDLSNAAWEPSPPSNSTAVQSTAVSPPPGCATLTLITATANGGTRLHTGATVIGGQPLVATYRIRAATGTVAQLRLSDGVTGQALITINTATGAITATAAGTYTSVSATSTALGDGWFLYTVNATQPAGQTSARLGVYVTNSGDAIYATGFDVRRANDTNIPYQRIAAATNYATGAAFPQYLAFDGTDDSLLTSSVDFATVTSDGQARRNLLTNPTQFDVTTSWATARAAFAVSTAVPPPAGISNLFKLTEDTTASNTHFFLSAADTTVVNATRYVSSIYARAAERSWIQLQEGQGVTAGAYFDLANGTIGTISGTGSPTAAIENIGSGWYRCSISWVALGTAARVRVYLATGDNGAVYTGNGTSGAYLSAAQLETGSTATAFQNIGTDKMTVWSGVSKLNDTLSQLIELSADVNSNNGAFSMPPSVSSGTYSFSSKGTAISTATSAASFSAPITNVLTGIGNISGDIAQLRINGTAAATSTTDQGTGNFGNYALFIGRRNNATIPFNGRIYSLIVRGAQSNSTQIAQTEKWVASKTPLWSVP